jgi:hypothetical protein
MMKPENIFKKNTQITSGPTRLDQQPLHPAWHALMEFCAGLGHGEITTLKIQNGLPVLAEVTIKKVKFAR